MFSRTPPLVPGRPRCGYHDRGNSPADPLWNCGNLDLGSTVHRRLPLSCEAVSRWPRHWWSDRLCAILAEFIGGGKVTQGSTSTFRGSNIRIYLRQLCAVLLHRNVRRLKAASVEAPSQKKRPAVLDSLLTCRRAGFLSGRAWGSASPHDFASGLKASVADCFGGSKSRQTQDRRSTRYFDVMMRIACHGYGQAPDVADRRQAFLLCH